MTIRSRLFFHVSIEKGRGGAVYSSSCASFRHSEYRAAQFEQATTRDFLHRELDHFYGEKTCGLLRVLSLKIIHKKPTLRPLIIITL